MFSLAANADLRERYCGARAAGATALERPGQCGFDRKPRAGALDRHDAVIALRAQKFETMEFASERNESAVGEWNGFWKALKLLPKPVRMPGKKGACIVHAPPDGKRQDGRALGVADFEGKPLGTSRPPQCNIASDFRHPEYWGVIEGDYGSC